MLDIQIAFALLGIGLAGLCPFVVTQLRQLGKLEDAVQGQLLHLQQRGHGSANGVLEPGLLRGSLEQPLDAEAGHAGPGPDGPGNPDDPAVTTPAATHVSLTQPVTLQRDPGGNVIGVTCVVVVN